MEITLHTSTSADLKAYSLSNNDEESHELQGAQMRQHGGI